MSKKRKTRKEKILAQQRHVEIFAQAGATLPTYSFSGVQKTHSNPTNSYSKFESRSYTYVLYDMKRTLTITASILVGSVIIFELIQNHIIRLAIFGY